jgi:hypothetical protein
MAVDKATGWHTRAVDWRELSRAGQRWSGHVERDAARAASAR